MNKRAASLHATPSQASMAKKLQKVRAKDTSKLLIDKMRYASASNIACRSYKYRDHYGSSLRDEMPEPAYRKP